MTATGKVVVDNSVVMAWCFKDVGGPYAEGVLDALADYEAVVPAIWPLEVANVLTAGERRQRLTAADSTHFLDLLGKLPITVVGETPERVFGAILSLARETGLSSYDASYLDLAMREGLPLATLDEKLARAAKEKGVILFQVRKVQ